MTAELIDGNTLEAEVSASPAYPRLGEVVTLSCQVRRGRERRGRLRVSWQTPTGVIVNDDAQTSRWRAVGAAGVVRIQVTVSDDDGSAQGGTLLSLRLPRGGARDFVKVAKDRGSPAGQNAAVEGARAAAALRARALETRSYSERLEAWGELDAIGIRFLEASNYEEAHQIYSHLGLYVMRNEPSYRDYAARLGRAAYYLGKESEAFTALTDAGAWRSAGDHYLYGDLLERQRRMDDAIKAHMAAWDNDHGHVEPIYRAALLRLRRGDAREAVADMLVEASSRIGRAAIIDRLENDEELAPVMVALRDSGRVAGLRERRRFRWTSDGKREDIVNEGELR